MLDGLDGRRPDAPAALCFEAASFAYGAVSVFRDVTLRIDAGEMVGLLGPNGAGKSTLLKLASGIARPQAGRVLLDTHEAYRLPRAAAARRVAVVPQEFSVQFAYTVRQLVALGRTAHLGAWGVLSASDHAAVEAALAATGLADLADRVYNALSGGERQRVLVAMALAQSSGILLLDEPTAHLDIRHQVEVLELLRRLNRERGLTVIAALHDLNLAARYFPRLVLFRHGVVADGPPASVLDADVLAAIYQTPVQVGILRGEAYLSVLPPAGQTAAPPTEHEKERRAPPQRASSHAGLAAAHVVAGGGSGELAMRSLADAGIPFTAGALNIGDSDQALAARLAVACVTQPPYTPIAAEAVAATRAHMDAAGAVVLCPTPIGAGNLALLEVALEVARMGKHVLLLEPGLSPASATLAEEMRARVQSRDFTDGRASATYAALLAAGARVAGSPAAVVELVRAFIAESNESSAANK
jgi:iron complex transport system ATP-binding protein